MVASASVDNNGEVIAKLFDMGAKTEVKVWCKYYFRQHFCILEKGGNLYICIKIYNKGCGGVDCSSLGCFSCSTVLN